MAPNGLILDTFLKLLIKKKLLEGITVVNYFFKVSMIVQISVGYNQEKPCKLKLTEQLAKNVKVTLTD